MPTDPAHAVPGPEPESEATEVFDAPFFGQVGGGYADRYDEDAFDYPAHAEPWSAGVQSPTAAEAEELCAPSASAGAEKEDGVREARSPQTGLRQQMSARRRPLLLLAAALV